MGRILSNRTVVAAKVEVTEGTAIALAGADASFQIMEPKFEADISMFDRDILDVSLSRFKAIPGTKLGKINFKVENKGSGTAGTAPAFGKLLRACGFTETVVAVTSVTYTPESSLALIPSLTIAVYRDGVKEQIRGARGNVKYSAKNGEPGMWEFEFVGVYDGVSDVALITPSGVETTVPIPLLNATFSIAAFSAFASQVSFDMGNKLEPRADINKAEGFISTLLTGRDPKGSVDPELELVATFDFYGRWVAGTTGVLTFRHTGSAGNICIVSAPVCQFAKISESDRNGLATVTADFNLPRNAAGGNDEISIAYT
jgi:hypothetical protein